MNEDLTQQPQPIRSAFAGAIKLAGIGCLFMCLLMGGCTMVLAWKIRHPFRSGQQAITPDTAEGEQP